MNHLSKTLKKTTKKPTQEFPGRPAGYEYKRKFSSPAVLLSDKPEESSLSSASQRFRPVSTITESPGPSQFFDMEPPKILPPTRQSKGNQDSIKKVAVTMHAEQTLFLELDQNRPLAAVVQDIARQWKLAEAENYSLQFQEKNRQNYITERNRSEIMNGNVLALTASPAKRAQELLEKLKTGESCEKLDSLKQLATLAADSTFAMEFINNNGHPLLVGIIESGKYHGEPLAFALKSFVALMDHSIISWDVLEPGFIKKIAQCVAVGKEIPDISILQSALEILESVVTHSGKHSVVEGNVQLGTIMTHLQSNNPLVQKNGIALLNALFLKTDSDKKKITDSFRSLRHLVTNNIIRSAQVVGDEMAHQLYVLQVLVLNMHENRMRTSAEMNDPAVQAGIEELKKVAFGLETESSMGTIKRSPIIDKDYRKLGFENCTSPTDDFLKIPPGLLALDNMLHFARSNEESFIKVVLENCTRMDEHDCPFVRASIAVTAILCDIFKVGDPPMDDTQSYFPMIFGHDKPFEELFCICIQTLNKTWREMRATSQDFLKVIDVVKEQIVKALDLHPPTLEAFKSRINQLTYGEIKKLWERERQNKEESESQAKPIIELRNRLTPEIMELIKKQRINYLLEGTRFSTRMTKSKDKYCYWRLAPNHKALHYGDCSDSDKPSLDQLPCKLSIVDIKDLLTGRDCPHVKEKGKKNMNVGLAFAIVADGKDDPFCFTAASDVEYDMWTDGLNALLEKEMTSAQTKEDLKILLNMEIKLRLLDIEGIKIPTEPPPIPPEPSNYDFCYTF